MCLGAARGEDDHSALSARGWGRGAVGDVQPGGLSRTAQRRGPRVAQRRGRHNNQTLFEKNQTKQDFYPSVVNGLLVATLSW